MSSDSENNGGNMIDLDGVLGSLARAQAKCEETLQKLSGNSAFEVTRTSLAKEVRILGFALGQVWRVRAKHGARWTSYVITRYEGNVAVGDISPSEGLPFVDLVLWFDGMKRLHEVVKAGKEIVR